MGDIRSFNEEKITGFFRLLEPGYNIWLSLSADPDDMGRKNPSRSTRRESISITPSEITSLPLLGSRLAI